MRACPVIVPEQERLLGLSLGFFSVVAILLLPVGASGILGYNLNGRQSLYGLYGFSGTGSLIICPDTSRLDAVLA